MASDKKAIKNNGEASQNLFEKILEQAYGKEVFIERLPDTKSIKGLMKKGFIQGRPSDYLVTIKGDMHYAEVKSSENATSFPFGNIAPEQWRAMKRQRAAGGKYYIYIHHLLTDLWYKVECRQILAVEEAGTKSIKWENMTLWTIQNNPS